MKKLYCFSERKGTPNRKTDIICDSDIVVHLSASIPAAEERVFVLGQNKEDTREDNA